MSLAVAAPFAGPWPDGRDQARAELAAYLAEVADGSIDALPTRCEPWTVRDVTAHLAATFERFARTLDQGRNGDGTPPFAMDQLDAENLRAVEEFSGDPSTALGRHAEAFLGAVDDLDQAMPHQLGVIPVGLVVLFGLMDLAVHHDDVTSAAGRRYRPPRATIDAISPVVERLFGVPVPVDDPWPTMVSGSGRPWP